MGGQLSTTATAASSSNPISDKRLKIGLIWRELLKGTNRSNFFFQYPYISVNIYISVKIGKCS